MKMSEDLELTPEERAELDKYLNSYGSPEQDPKHNVHTFSYAFCSVS